MFGFTVVAQNMYVFSDKDGNVYDDGATIVCSEVEDDGFGGIMIPSGLYVKNADAPDGCQVSIQANITRIDNGALQLCFPVNCESYTTTGQQGETSKTPVGVGDVKNLMTEWLPTQYGECVVTYTAKMYQTLFAKGERTITVNYKYASPTGIEQMEAVGTQPAACYDLQGRRTDALQRDGKMSTPKRGLNIIVMSDGSVRKVVLK